MSPFPKRRKLLLFWRVVVLRSPIFKSSAPSKNLATSVLLREAIVSPDCWEYQHSLIAYADVSISVVSMIVCGLQNLLRRQQRFLRLALPCSLAAGFSFSMAGFSCSWPASLNVSKVPLIWKLQNAISLLLSRVSRLLERQIWQLLD